MKKFLISDYWGVLKSSEDSLFTFLFWDERRKASGRHVGADAENLIPGGLTINWGGVELENRNKKLLALFISVVLIMSVLSACGGNNTNENVPTSNEPDQSEASQSPEATDGDAEKSVFPLDEKVTLEMVACKHPNNGPFNEMDFFKQYEEKTNVHIDWTDIEFSQCEEQRNLILASGELPDAFYGTLALTGNDVINYGGQGMLVPLEQYITKETMPNLSALIEQNPKYKAMLTAPDGHIYSLPSIRELMLWLSPDMMYLNKEWLDNLGLEVPTTMEELRNVLEAFKTQDPNGNGKNDEIPFSFLWDFANYNVNGIGSLFGAFGRADSATHIFVEDGKVVFSAKEPEYKEAIQYFHTFFEDGLFDKESLAQDRNQLLGKGSGTEQRLGGFFAWNAFSIVGVDNDPKYVVVPALKGPNGDQVWRKSLNNNQGVNPFAFSMTVENQHPELTMQWIDLSYATDTSIEAGWGPIGTTLEDKDGTLTLKDAPDGLTTDQYVFKTAPVEAPYAILENTYGTRLAMAEKDKVKIDGIKENYLPYMTSETFPGVMFTAEESQRIKTLDTDLNSYINQTSAKWLLEGGVEEEWDNYLDDLNKMKVDELISIYQTAYDRFISAQS
ncbi:type 2 periplasmic-binding domain-containing protein [Paenibacillus lactis]|uniref:extracellular solute-binding protein n=1 Tax=Paenibacillus lactis TaxID=228574 RepID=UPI0001AFD963|nr:ABC transporter, solute-binding protein [Paenibacillus sp. oral taxon 786 str. D14]